MNPIKSFFVREVKDWPVWWSEQRGLRRHGTLALVLLYWGVLFASGVFSKDHVIL